ncbi:hypothetical protein GIB67_000351 [Kingdonia uniflora]|uniref:SWIRM domain-containing protein n=1 Tax=Kingdonia uniflora TaxID=39325 RepID=A0A7J7LCG6_9MAGN|nr:hypothetical protein GIB67_000351 [Kingdonia uniflora]
MAEEISQIPNYLSNLSQINLPQQNPNPNPLFSPNTSSPFPRKRRRARSMRKLSSLSLRNQVFSRFAPSSNNNINESSNFLPNSTLNVSEEIIFINKEATAEALIALSTGFPADSLTEEEIDFGVVSVVGGIEQVNYILIRNHIIMRWKENVLNWLTKEAFIGLLPPHCRTLLNSAYGFLLSHGYINFGVSPAIKEKITAEGSKAKVIVVGAGLAGLAAARQLISFGFKVVILEGRKRAGGRVYTKKMEGGFTTAEADLGGSVLTGTLGNPLAILARQLSYPMHKVRDKCPLYSPEGNIVDPDMDSKVEIGFNRLLDKVSRLRQLMGEVSVDVSLGAALDTFQEVTPEEANLFNWHLANLEYANAGLLSKLSLAFWDQDDPYDMGGDHCFVPGGNGKLVQALAENLPILYEKTVHTIRYGGDGVQVISGGQVFEGDMALCTVPLGVLKSGSIKFIPELPQRKLDGIKRMGFGLLNKVAMLFPHVFWGTDLDTFGHLCDDSSRRGEFFLFYSYATVAGGPLLIALVAGEAAHKFESMPPTDAVSRVLQILKGIYLPQGIEVPEPIQTVCTRWGGDPFSLGSYSNVAVGASGDDYDILAENVGDGRLFFAGEATTRRYPATMHGAFLTGLREAASMARHANSRASRKRIERSPSTNTHSCAAILADLFRDPDLEFGSFSVIFARTNSDPKSMAVLRVTFNGSRKKGTDGSKTDQQHSNKLLFQQLQSHFNQQQQLHVYTLLSRQQALELREVRGGDEMRLHHLSEKIGVKLVGRKGLGPAADSVIASIKAERGRHKSTLTSSAMRSGTLKRKVNSSKYTNIRRVKAVRKGNITVAVGKVNNSVEVSKDNNSVEVSKAKSSAEVSKAKSSTEVSKDNNSAEVSKANNLAEVNKVNNLAEVSNGNNSAEVSKVKSLAEVSKVESLVEVSMVNNSAEVSKVNNLAEVSKGNILVEVSNLNSLAEVSKVKSLAEVSMVNNSAEVSKVNNLAEVSTGNTSVEVCKLNNSAEASKVNDSVDMSKVNNLAEVSKSSMSVRLVNDENLFAEHGDLTAATVRSAFAPFVEIVKTLNLPEWLVHWGHPGNMVVVLFAMGGYGTYLGFRIRYSDDVEEKAKAKDLHPKLLAGMFFFFALGATGGITSLLTSDKPILESPHAITGLIGLSLLTIQTILPTLFEGRPELRSVHGILGSGIMALFLIHSALGLQLGLST